MCCWASIANSKALGDLSKHGELLATHSSTSLKTSIFIKATHISENQEGERSDKWETK
jgi:hypothetical protein